MMVTWWPAMVVTMRSAIFIVGSASRRASICW
jgi:hypothetical protein